MKHQPTCLSCSVPIAPNAFIIAHVKDRDERLPLCSKHQKTIAQFLKNSGLAAATFVPLSRLRLFDDNPDPKASNQKPR